MASLYFKILADYQELDKLRKELKKFEAEMKNFKPGSDIFKAVESRYKETVKLASSLDSRIVNSSNTYINQIIKQISEEEKRIEVANMIIAAEDKKIATARAAAASIDEEIAAQTNLERNMNKTVATLEKERAELSIINLKRKELALSETMSGKITEQSILDRQRLVAEEAKLRDSINKNNIVLRSQVKEMNAADGSVDQLRARLVQLNRLYDSLGASMQQSSFGTALQKNIGELNDKVLEFESSTGRFGRNVGNYASGFNMLNFQVQQVVRELPSLAMGANMFFLAISNNLPMLVDELNRAKKSYNEYTEAIKKGIKDVQKVPPVWKQVLSSLMSWQTVLVVGITLLTRYGGAIVDWVKGLFKGRDAALSVAEAQEQINAKMKDSYADIAKQRVSYEQLKRSYEALGDSIQQRSKFIADHQADFEKLGLSIHNVDDADNAFVNNTDAFVDSLKLRAQAAAATQLAIESYTSAMTKQMEADSARQKGPSRMDRFLSWGAAAAGNYNTTPEAFRSRRINALQSEADAAKEAAGEYLKLIDAREKEADAGLEQAGLSGNKDTRNKAYWENQRKFIQDQMDALDVSEIGGAKWEELTKKITQADAQLKLYNTTSKENQKLKPEQGSVGYYDAEIKKLKELQEAYGVTTDKYQEFQHKIDALTIRRDILSGATFDKMMEDITEAGEEAAGKAQEYLDNLLSQSQESWNKYYTEFGSYEEKRLAIIEKYNRKIDQAQTEGERAIYQKEQEKALKDLDLSMIEQTDLWIRLFSDARDHTNAYIQETIDDIQRLLDYVEDKKNGLNPDDSIIAALGFSPDQIEALIADPQKLQSVLSQLTKQKEALNARNPFKALIDGFRDMRDAGGDAEKQMEALHLIMEGFDGVANIISAIGDALSNAFGEKVGNAIQSVSSTLQQVGNMAQLGGMIGGGPIGAGIGAGIGLITSIIGGINKRQEESRKIRQAYLQSLVDDKLAEYEINQLYRERYEWAKKIGETTLSYLNRNESELKKQSDANAREQEELMRKLYGESYVSGQTYKHGTWFRKAKVTQQWSSLAGKSFDDIELLAAQGKLTENGMKYYEALKKAREEGEDLTERIEQLAEETREAFTGIGYDSLVDSIVDGFKQGKRSAADFAGDFEEMMSDAVYQSLKMTALEEPLRKWYEDFAAAAQDDEGLTAEEIAQLKAQYDRIIANAAKQTEQMEDITGVDLGALKQGQATGKGYQTMSQDTGDELNGRFTAIQSDTHGIFKLLNGIYGVNRENMYSLYAANTNLQQLCLTGDEMRNLSQASLIQLQKIQSNTKETVRVLQEEVRGDLRTIANKL